MWIIGLCPPSPQPLPLACGKAAQKNANFCGGALSCRFSPFLKEVGRLRVRKNSTFRKIFPQFNKICSGLGEKLREKVFCEQILHFFGSAFFRKV